LLREARLFDAKLGPIDGAGNVGSHLIGLVVAKTVVQPKAEPKQEADAKTNEENTPVETEKSSAEAT
jgi:vacuolar protein sorting-associated protein 54